MGEIRHIDRQSAPGDKRQRFVVPFRRGGSAAGLVWPAVCTEEQAAWPGMEVIGEEVARAQGWYLTTILLFYIIGT
jgi:hypothetical protein